MNVDELIDAVKLEFENPNDPNEVFRLHDEVQRLPQSDLEKFRKSGYSEALAMSYLAAVEMQRDGTWDTYVEECINRKKKTFEEIKKELMEISHDKGRQ